LESSSAATREGVNRAVRENITGREGIKEILILQLTLPTTHAWRLPAGQKVLAGHAVH